jgi:hypothetical protein
MHQLTKGRAKPGKGYTMKDILKYIEDAAQIGLIACDARPPVRESVPVAA